MFFRKPKFSVQCFTEKHWFLCAWLLCWILVSCGIILRSAQAMAGESGLDMDPSNYGNDVSIHTLIHVPLESTISHHMHCTCWSSGGSKYTRFAVYVERNYVACPLRLLYVKSFSLFASFKDTSITLGMRSYKSLECYESSIIICLLHIFWALQTV